MVGRLQGLRLGVGRFVACFLDGRAYEGMPVPAY